MNSFLRVRGRAAVFWSANWFLGFLPPVLGSGEVLCVLFRATFVRVRFQEDLLESLAHIQVNRVPVQVKHNSINNTQRQE